MTSRVLPLTLAALAAVADGAGAHRVALYLVLLAIPGAAGAAFVAASDAFEGRRGAAFRAMSTTLALVLLVVASAVRENAPHGAAVPPLAISAIFAALVAYALPLVGWLVEPVPLRARPAPVRADGAARETSRLAA